MIGGYYSIYLKNYTINYLLDNFLFKYAELTISVKINNIINLNSSLIVVLTNIGANTINNKDNKPNVIYKA